MLYAAGVACFGALLAPSPLLSTPAGAAAIAAPRAGGVSMDLSQGTVNVGIIGAGRIGLTHLDALGMCKNAIPIIISNPTVSKAEAAAKAFPGMEFTGSDVDVINHPDVEAVWICSPSQFHSQQITACADAGKHVFCEKPLATDLQATIEAVNYCRTKGVKLMTALQRRFDPNFVRIKQAITSGEIGEPIIVKLCSRDPAPPPYEYVKGGGGIFKDMAVHDLDMARFLMGCEPVKVLATGSCNIDKAIEDLPGPEAFDTASIVVRFENGKDAIIDVCRQAKYGYDQRAEVLGFEGMVQSENMAPSTVRKFNAEFVGHADMPYDFFMSRYKEAYVRETNAFIDALVNDKPAPCSGRDGLVALVMAMAAGISATEERWVDFGEVIRREKLADFGELLNEDGKLKKNWVRGVMLTVERDPMNLLDIEEVWNIFASDGKNEDGKLDQKPLKQAIALFKVDVKVEDIMGGKERITYEEFVTAWKDVAGFDATAQDQGLKGLYQFLDTDSDVEGSVKPTPAKEATTPA